MFTYEPQPQSLHIKIKCFDFMTNCLTSWRVLTSWRCVFDVMTCFDVMTNFLASWRAFVELFDIFFTSWQTFWRYDVFVYAMTNFLTYFWCDKLFDIMTCFDVITNFGVMTCFWRHDELFVDTMCFWRHDELVDVMTYFDVITNFLTSWRTFLHHDESCWRHGELFDVMTCFWGHDELFDVIEGLVRLGILWILVLIVLTCG